MLPSSDVRQTERWRTDEGCEARPGSLRGGGAGLRTWLAAAPEILRVRGSGYRDRSSGCSQIGSMLSYGSCVFSTGIPLSASGRSIRTRRSRSGFGFRSLRRLAGVGQQTSAECSEPRIFWQVIESCSTSRATRIGWSHRSSTPHCVSCSFGLSARTPSTIGLTQGRCEYDPTNR
jgi:hypothetical protein